MLFSNLPHLHFRLLLVTKHFVPKRAPFGRVIKYKRNLEMPMIPALSEIVKSGYESSSTGDLLYKYGLRHL